MKNILAAGAALGLAMTAPVAAQDMADDMGMEMTDAQMTAYDSWSAEQQTSYDGWPEAAQTYYWTLTDTQQAAWWELDDTQRTQILALAPAARTQFWNNVRTQDQSASMTSSATTTTTTTSAPMAATRTSGTIQFRSSERVQGTPAGYTQATGDDLPVCSANQQDGCINSWEKNRTGTRPLDYWPGQPASEMD